MEMETETKRGKGGAVLLGAVFLMSFGGYVVPKIWESASAVYTKQREQILLNMIGNDLDGKAFEVDPNRKQTMIAPMMERNDLLKALYVLDLRYRQQKGVIDGIRSAAEWDGHLGEE